MNEELQLKIAKWAGFKRKEAHTAPIWEYPGESRPYMNLPDFMFWENIEKWLVPKIGGLEIANVNTNDPKKKWFVRIKFFTATGASMTETFLSALEQKIDKEIK